MSSSNVLIIIIIIINVVVVCLSSSLDEPSGVPLLEFINSKFYLLILLRKIGLVRMLFIRRRRKKILFCHE